MLFEPLLPSSLSSSFVVAAAEPGQTKPPEIHFPTVVATVLLPLQPKLYVRVGGFGCEQRMTEEMRESEVSVEASTVVPPTTCSAIAGHRRSPLLSLSHGLVRVLGFGVVGVSSE